MRISNEITALIRPTRQTAALMISAKEREDMPCKRAHPVLTLSRPSAILSAMKGLAMRRLLILGCLLASACGSSPAAPSASAPAPIAVALNVTVTIDCAGDTCTISGTAANPSASCVQQVSGVTSLYEPDNFRAIAVPWTIDGMLRPNQSGRFAVTRDRPTTATITSSSASGTATSCP